MLTHRELSGSTDSAVTHWRPRTHWLCRLLADSFLACGAAWAQTAPTIASVLNDFDYSTNLCPGALAAIYGTNFGTTASAVTITVGGKPGHCRGCLRKPAHRGNSIRSRNRPNHCDN